MERKNVPLTIQVEIAAQEASRRRISKPLWQLLLEGFGIQPPSCSQESPACPSKSSTIPEHPDNMNEALARLETLEEWIAQGRAPEEFYERFGPPKGF